jgi:hypothetical protein
MGRTACTEPQCLYKGALYLYTITKKLNFPFRLQLQKLGWGSGKLYDEM